MGKARLANDTFTLFDGTSSGIGFRLIIFSTNWTHFLPPVVLRLINPNLLASRYHREIGVCIPHTRYDTYAFFFVIIGQIECLSLSRGGCGLQMGDFLFFIDSGGGGRLGEFLFFIASGGGGRMRRIQVRQSRRGGGA